MSYIEREAAIKVLCDACGNAACPKGLIPRCSYYEKMQAIPAADVRPVVHGEWIHFSRSDECSVCGYDTGKYEAPTWFCPKCGADMRKKEET